MPCCAEQEDINGTRYESKILTLRLMWCVMGKVSKPTQQANQFAHTFHIFHIKQC